MPARPSALSGLGELCTGERWGTHGCPVVIKCDVLAVNALDQCVNPHKACVFVTFNPLSFTARLISTIEFDVNAAGFHLARRITVPRTQAMKANGMALASNHKTCLLEMPG